MRKRGIRAGLSLRYEHRQISALRCRNEILKFKHNSWQGAKLNNLCYVRQCEQFPLRPTQPGFRPTGNLISSNGNTHEIMSNESQISVRITRNRYPTNRLQLRNPGNLTKINNTHSQEETTANKIRLALWNAQSLQKKSASVCDIMLSNKLDIFAVTETWLASNGNNTSLTEILNFTDRFQSYSNPERKRKRRKRCCIVFGKFSTPLRMQVLSVHPLNTRTLLSVMRNSRHTWL